VKANNDNLTDEHIN